MADKTNGKVSSNGWSHTKEKILLFFGICVISAELVNAEFLSGTFHLEFLIAGLALCGISIAQWGK